MKKRVTCSLSATTLFLVVASWGFATSALAQLCTSDTFCVEALDEVTQGATSAANKTADEVQDATNPVNPLSNETGEVVDTVGGTLDEIGGGDPTVNPPPKTTPGGGHNKDPRKGSGGNGGFRGEVLGSTAHNSARDLARARGLDPDRARELSQAAAYINHESDLGAGLLENLRTALQTFTFPLALIVMVVAFLLIQSRVDSRDPKLALAPVNSEQDYLSFS